jgi:hypothetical protein
MMIDDVLESIWIAVSNQDFVHTGRTSAWMRASSSFMRRLSNRYLSNRRALAEFEWKRFQPHGRISGFVPTCVPLDLLCLF